MDLYVVCSSCGKLYRDEYSTISHYRKLHGGGASIWHVDLDNPELRNHYIKQYGITYLPTKYKIKAVKKTGGSYPASWYEQVEKMGDHHGMTGLHKKQAGTVIITGEFRKPERVDITPIKKHANPSGLPIWDLPDPFK